MRRLILLLGASALATPALAQHQGHSTPPATAPDTSCTLEHAAMGHCTMPPAKQPTDPDAGHARPQQPDPHADHQMPAKEPDPTCTPEHAAMGHCTLPPPAADHVDPHAGHAMPTQPDPHAGHDMPSTAVDPPVAPPPAEAFEGPEHAADAVYGDTAMARSRREMHRMHGALPAYRVLIDRFEAQIGDGRDGYAIDAEAWYGGDIDKLWLKAESHGEFGERFEGAELQALWSHAIGPWFDLQTGVRYDARRGPDRGHLVLGVQGLAPYWIEIDAAAFLSDRGDVTGRFEAEHDVRITQRLILQPRGELDFALQDIPRERIGAGLSQAALGARLRYQVTQLFSPYVGLQYQRAFGDTRRFLKADGEDAGGWSLLAGLRVWF